MINAPAQSPSEPPELSGPGRIVPRQPPALPGGLANEGTQQQIDAIVAELRGARALDTLLPADQMRRRWGYVFYALGGLLPTGTIVHLLWTGAQALRELPHREGNGGLAVALWIFYALPVVASLLTGAAFFSIGGRLQMSTPAVERMEHLKAGKARGKGSLALELPKGVKMAGSELSGDD
jgi:hypothetical protein